MQKNDSNSIREQTVYMNYSGYTSLMIKPFCYPTILHSNIAIKYLTHT